jgi:hypothetical protein
MLHDVGMQMLRHTQKPIGNMTEQDFAVVRHEHADQSGVKIEHHPVDCGLPDEPALASAIAGVARAHGTKFYRPTVEAMAPVAFARGEELRTRLLAALLLFADELDLEYSRATPPSGEVVLPAVSHAHMFKHSCVDRCRVSLDDLGEIKVSLNLTFSSEMAADETRLVEQWITGKLQQQMGMVEPEIIAGFRGQVRFSRAIEVIRQSASNRAKPASDVLAIIRSEVALSDLINHKDAYTEALEALNRANVVILAGEFNTDFGRDESGREDLFSAVVTYLRTQPRPVIEAVVASINLGAAAGDIVAGWLKNGNISIEEDEGREALKKLLVQLVHEAPTGVVLAASSIDTLPGRDRTWIGEVLIPEVVAQSPATSFVFTAGAEGVLRVPGVNVVAILAGGLPDEDVSLFMRRVMPDDIARSMPGPRTTYAEHKSLYERRQLALAGAV